MPVVAVVAAIAVDAGAAATFAGGVAITSTLGALSVVAAIGATTAAVGAVTGNKTFEEVGGALGIIGAVGTLAVASGAVGNVSDILPSSADASGAADAGAAADSAAAGSATDPGDAIVEGATTPATGAITTTDNPVGAINTTSIVPAEGNAAAIETGGQAGVVPAGSLSPAQLNALTMDTPAAQDPGNAAAEAARNAPTPDQASLNAEVNAAAPPGQSAYDAQLLSDGLSQMSSGTAPGGLLAWAKANPQLASVLGFGVIQAGGAFISGLTNPVTPAQINALDSQAAANNAAATLTQKQAANVSQPLPTATVTGTPANTGGLINSKPIGSPQITGAPNTVSLINNAQTATAPPITGVPA